MNNVGGSGQVWCRFEGDWDDRVEEFEMGRRRVGRWDSW